MTTQEKIAGIKVVIELLQIAQEQYKKDMERISGRSKPSDADYQEYSEIAKISCEISHAIRLCEKVIDKYNDELVAERKKQLRRASSRTLQGRISKTMRANQDRSQYEQISALNQILRNIPIR